MPIEVLTEAQHPARVNVDALRGARIAVLGYGNQGSAHALNLRDSGLDVVVGNRPDTANARRAAADDFEPMALAEAAADADLIIVALPDELHGVIFRERLRQIVRRGQVLGFIHGFSVRFGLIEPPSGVAAVLVAPKGPGALVRSLFEQGRGLPCLFGTQRGDAPHDPEPIALAWAAGIGAGRAGIIRTTFAAEAESDLFGEQAVLCGGVCALMIAGFETLIQRGYEPEVAYIEACHELKQVVDLIYERGLRGMFDAISTTAAFGAFEAMRVIDDDSLRAKFRALLDRIQSGEFTAAMMEDAKPGEGGLGIALEKLAAHPITEAGDRVRRLMPWLSEGSRPDAS